MSDTIGYKIIDLIIGTPLFTMECPDNPNSGCIAKWVGNAADQLDALVNRELASSGPPASTEWTEALADAADTLRAERDEARRIARDQQDFISGALGHPKIKLPWDGEQP